MPLNFHQASRRRSSSQITTSTNSTSESHNAQPGTFVHILPPPAGGHRRTRSQQESIGRRPTVDLVLPGGRMFTQVPPKPVPRPPKANTQQGPPRQQDTEPSAPSSPFNFNAIYTTRTPTQTTTRQKKERQWVKWSRDVIPRLVFDHLRLLRISSSLRTVPRKPVLRASCKCQKHRNLTITIVYLNRKFSLSATSYPF